MCRLFETLRIENGKVLHADWHEQRIIRSFREIWGKDPFFSPGDIIRVPEEFRSGTVRCKLIYDHSTTETVFSVYRKKAVRSLKIVEAAGFDYHLKYLDRSSIEMLYALREDCDDIILLRDGMLTDTSFSNLVFYNGSQWVSPAGPLLEGTARARLLSEGRIIMAEIRPEDLGKYKGCKLINAMKDINEEEIIPIGGIRGSEK